MITTFFNRRTALSLALGLALGGSALAQTTPLRVILPVGAGSGVDTIMRSAQTALSKALGDQPVVIENMPRGRWHHRNAGAGKGGTRWPDDCRGVQQPRRESQCFQKNAL